MNPKHIVTYCLAVWAKYAQQLTQEDKDFFDANVSHVCNMTSSIVEAISILISLKLESEGVKNPKQQTINLIKENKNIFLMAE